MISIEEVSPDCEVVFPETPHRKLTHSRGKVGSKRPTSEVQKYTLAKLKPLTATETETFLSIQVLSGCGGSHVNKSQCLRQSVVVAATNQ